MRIKQFSMWPKWITKWNGINAFFSSACVHSTLLPSTTFLISTLKDYRQAIAWSTSCYPIRQKNGKPATHYINLSFNKLSHFVHFHDRLIKQKLTLDLLFIFPTCRITMNFFVWMKSEPHEASNGWAQSMRYSEFG